MAQRIRIRSIKRREIGADQLALAFLLLAKILQEREDAESQRDITSDDDRSSATDPEAA